ncbi:Nucleotide excision repair protein, with UvrB/UvrC motif [Chitinispirillum alkaliphilum]|nr:Nucleotide excision repair protein, with UvrB/UvrC motif [Chitinispirillum alkaliphilum]
MKICDECGIKPANIHLTQVMQNETEVFHLCEECARKKGISISIDNQQASDENCVIEEEKTCENCGMKLSVFRSKGWLGCSGCYNSFEKEIDELLIQVHGSSIHRGKKYLGDAVREERTCDLERLRNEMDIAIKNEDFEQAAAIRDVIHNLKEMGVE